MSGMPIVSKNALATGRDATIGLAVSLRGGGSPSVNNGAPPQKPRPEIGTQFTIDADRTPGSAATRARMA
jgi:hypothetical protein